MITRSLKLIGRGVFFLLDIFLAASMCVSTLPLAVAFRFSPRRRRRCIALLVPGGDIASIYRKYGTLDVYFQDNPSNYFDHCYRFLFAGTNNCRLELRRDFTVCERKLPLSVLRLTYLVKLVLELSLLAIREQISILHARDPCACGLVMWAVSRLTRTPFCVSIHADYDLGYALAGSSESISYWRSRTVGKMVENFVLSHAQMVLPIRESLARYAIRHGARPRSIRVIPHGINLTPFRANDQTDYRKLFGLDGKKVVCFVGRLSKDNYSDDIIEIARLMVNKRDDVALLLVGDGSERSRLESRCRELKLTEVVRFVGFQPKDAIPGIRRMADVNLCLMAGFSLIEACAAGRPVVSYDVDWHYELVKNDETGYLVPEGKVQNIVEAICSLLDNPEKSKLMGENAKRLVFERHALERTDAIKVQAYEELMTLQS